MDTLIHIATHPVAIVGILIGIGIEVSSRRRKKSGR